MRFFILAIYVLISFISLSAQQIYSLDTIQMGVVYNYTVVADSDTAAQLVLQKMANEVARIEKLISSWDENSETSLINQNAGITPVKVSPELFNLIQRSQSISKISNGYFDISFAAINWIWQFDGQKMKMPSDSILQESVSKINYQNIQLDKANQTVFLKDEGMKIGFGAIGKGYAANIAKKIALENGMENGVVNAGGDLLAWGEKPNHEKWIIGIPNPIQKEEILLQIDISESAVVTSGDYEKFVMINDERYGHIINPKTGKPSKGVLSVTIIAPDAEIADAFATTVFVLGEKEGLEWINHLDAVECIIVNSEKKMIFSKGVNPFIVSDE